jgi:hypothetical protein
LFGRIGCETIDIDPDGLVDVREVYEGSMVAAFLNDAVVVEWMEIAGYVPYDAITYCECFTLENGHQELLLIVH